MIPNQKQTKHLKSLCHALTPVVRIGQKGVTDAVMSELEIALSHHELIKIKVSVGDRDARSAAITQIADTCLLYTSPSPRDQRGSRMPSSA